MSDQRVLVISAHAADFGIRCGGTIARYTGEGAAVRVLVLTYGERGESNEVWIKKGAENVSEQMVKEIRRAEAEAAAAALGADVAFFDWSDQPLTFNRERYMTLVREIRQFRPTIVLTHAPFEPHNPDHEEAYHATVKALYYARLAGVEPDLPTHDGVQIFMFEPTAPLTDFARFEPDVYVDITDVMATKQKAVAEFKVQPYHLDRYTVLGRSRGTQAAYVAHNDRIEYAEAFRRFKPQVSQRLHE